MLLGESENLYQYLQALTDQEKKETLEQIDDLLQPEKRFYWDFRFAAANYFKIVNKQRKTVPFILNSLQEALYRDIIDEFPIRSLILKARKFGISTFILLLYYWDCITSENTTSVIIAHEFDPSKRMFRIVSYTHNRLPDEFKPKTGLDNVRELFFGELNSTFFVGSAKKKDFGRSDTIDNLHCSELAFWDNPEEVLGAGLAEAVPEESGNVFVESTPSRSPYFRELISDCKENGEPYQYRFYPWFVFPEYRMEVDPGEEQAVVEALTDDEKLAMKTHDLSVDRMKFWLTKRRKLLYRVWQEFPMDDKSCFVSTDGSNFFDTRHLQELTLITSQLEPLMEIENGAVKIYNEPIPGESYMIAADTSGGGINSTYSAASVLRVSNAEEVAELRARLTPVQLAHILYRLGEMYNWALIAPERNNHGHSVINTLENQLFYPNMYYHIDLDWSKWAEKVSKVGKIKGKGTDPYKKGDAGWPTNAKTRPVMFDQLRDDVIDQKLMMVKSKIFVEECYGCKTKGDTIYFEGYGDTVIARCILWSIYQRSAPASLHTRPDQTLDKKQRDREMPWDKDRDVTFQTLDRTPKVMAGVKIAPRKRRQSQEAPWSV